jgi:DNA-binding Xre family transcriptional regulator
MPIRLRIDDLLDVLRDIEGPPNRTRYWLAKELGLSQATVWKYAGKDGVPRNSGITWDMLDRFCEALRCEPGDLIKRVV